MPTPRPGQIVFAEPRSYCTASGTHGGYPAVDAFAVRGTPIYAPYPGRAEPATYSLGGNACWLYCDAGAPYKVLYLAHGHVGFKRGRVKQGEQIGQVGDTGNAAGNPHVHYAGGDSDAQISERNGSGSFWFPSFTWGQGDGAPSPAPVPRRQFKVMVNGLRLRGAPGTTGESPIIAELPAGTVLTATVDDSYKWWRGMTVDGRVGWLAAEDDYVEEVS